MSFENDIFQSSFFICADPMTLRPIFFDLETTGLSPKSDRIIEIAAFDPVHNRSFERLVFPNLPLSKETTEICGITDEMLQSAPPFQTVAQEFLSFCEGDIVLIAHNGEQFDIPFLFFECQRIPITIPTNWYTLDSLKWARKYRKDLPRHSLQYLRQIFHIEENRAHRALDDVMILWSVFSLMTDDLTCEELIERGEGVRIEALLKNIQTTTQSTEKQSLLF